MGHRTRDGRDVFVEDRAEREDVGPRVGGLAAHLLRGHIYAAIVGGGKTRRERARRSGSCANADGKTLMATSRDRRVSRARYTSPMPPLPSDPAIS
jgi:hypothetical protein